MEEIKVDKDKEEINIQIPREEVEDNNLKIYLDDTIDIEKIVKELKNKDE